MSCLLNIGKTEGRASTSVMRTLPASSGYHDLRSSFDSYQQESVDKSVKKIVPRENREVPR